MISCDCHVEAFCSSSDRGVAAGMWMDQWGDPGWMVLTFDPRGIVQKCYPSMSENGKMAMTILRKFAKLIAEIEFGDAQF